jgi:hypothetical protein
MTPFAARQRRLRERRRRGVRVAKVEVSEVDLTEMLIGLGLLRACDADNWTKVEAALQKGLQVVIIDARNA